MNIKYFTCANSCQGFVNLTENNVSDIGKRFFISCSSRDTAANFIRRVGEYYENKNFSVEYILNPSDKNSLWGCIVRMLDFCVLSQQCGENGIKISLGEGEGLEALENKIKDCYEKMYCAYKEAKKIHDDWEKIYIENMNFEKLDAFKKQTAEQMFENKMTDRIPKSKERFFGASTKNGYVSLIKSLTEGIGKRYFIKGRPGTGKSTFMKEVKNEAEKRGFDTEVYKCSFDPESYDMVIVRGADFCVFDSTAPHEMFPSSDCDIILDFYRESGLEGVDEKYKNELESISKEYKLRINEGSEYLRLATILEKELESKAKDFVNYTASENMLKTLIAEINKGLFQ